jgi:hypothetical protein
MSDDHQKIRITLDEVERVVLDPPPRSIPPPSPRAEDTAGSRSWGRVDAALSYPTAADSVGAPNVFFKTWVYLGLAGLAGAFLAWVLCEPSFNDPPAPRGVGNIIMFPAFAMLVALGFAVAESAVEHSWRKGVNRVVLAVVLGIILGFVFNLVAQFVYQTGLLVLYNSG